MIYVCTAKGEQTYMGILEEMYYGKLECQERKWCNNELLESSKLCDRNREKLLSTMTDEQKVMFEKFLDCNDELHCISERESFIQGFRYGMQIIVDALSK